MYRLFYNPRFDTPLWLTNPEINLNAEYMNVHKGQYLINYYRHRITIPRFMLYNFYRVGSLIMDADIGTEKV